MLGDADAGTGRPGRDVNAHTCLCACASSPDSLLLFFSTLEPYLRIPHSHSPNHRCGYCFISCTSPRSNPPLSSEPSFSPHRARALALSLLVVARGARSSSSLKESPRRQAARTTPRTTNHVSRLPPTSTSFSLLPNKLVVKSRHIPQLTPARGLWPVYRFLPLRAPTSVLCRSPGFYPSYGCAMC